MFLLVPFSWAWYCNAQRITEQVGLKFQLGLPFEIISPRDQFTIIYLIYTTTQYSSKQKGCEFMRKDVSVCVRCVRLM